MERPSTTTTTSSSSRISSPIDDDDDAGMYKRLVVGEGEKTLRNSLSETMQQKSFWSVLANKAKATLLDNEGSNSESLPWPTTHARSSDSKQRRSEIPMFQKLESFTSSLSSFGDTIGNVLEEGLNIVETKATDILSSDSRRFFTKKSLGSTRTIVDSSSLEEYDAVQIPSILNEQDADSLSQKGPISRMYSPQAPDTVTRPQQKTQTGLKPLQRRDFVADTLLVQNESSIKTSHWDGHSSKQNSGVVKDQASNDIQIKASRDVRTKQGRENLARVLQGKDCNVDSQKIEKDLPKRFQQQDTNREGNSLADDKDMQLKASRDVAMAMATKAKLLARELKEAKVALVVAKQRHAQLEEENRTIRESLHHGIKLDEEDLVRIQLETLLAEKAHLAQENAYYARENQFLREMLEYHRLLSTQTNAAFLEYIPDTTEAGSASGIDEGDLPPETIISTVPS